MTGDDPAPSHSEALPRLLHRVTTLANEAEDARSALRRALEDVCETMAWPAGEVVSPPDRGPVAGVDTEYRRGAEPPPVRPLPPPTLNGDDGGRAASWRLLDGAEGDARSIGLLTLPLVAEGRTVAVMRFVTVGPEPPRDVVGTVRALVRQLGMLLERDMVRDRLRAVNDELARSNRELEQFAYVASHDLQEPLRKIVGFAELLESRYSDQLEGEAGEFLEIVVDGAQRMRRLIQDLLAYSRAGGRELALAPVDLSDVVDDAVRDLQTAVEESDARISVARPLPVVLGDADALRELLVNVIGNAIKYRAGPAPTIDVTAGTTDDGMCRMTVRDDGIGIPPQYHERIFALFQRLHPVTAYEGTGIGLAVSARIAQQHGGRLWVESSGSGGSAFHLTLQPAPDPDHGEPHA